MSDKMPRLMGLTAGGQGRLSVLPPPPPPPSFSSLPDRLREQATAAWNAGHRLDGLVRLWGHFLVFGMLGLRLDDETESSLAEAFPSLQDLGGVLNSLARDAAPPAEVVSAGQEFDQSHGIRRGPNARRSQEDPRPFRKKRLCTLIESFRRELGKHARALFLLGINLPHFGRPWPEVRKELDTITSIDLDLRGEGPLVDFGAKLTSREFLAACGVILQATGELVCLLGEYPDVVLPAPPVEVKAKKRRPKHLVNPAEANQLVKDYLKHHPRANVTRDEIAEATGLSAGLVSATPMWRLYAVQKKRQRRPAEPRGKKTGLDIAEEEQAWREWNLNTRDERLAEDEAQGDHASTDAGQESAKSDELADLVAQQVREQREDARRGRRSRK
jgi:hypothetical protein